MFDVKLNVTNLVSKILEYQKNIVLNKRCIRELESEGNDASGLKEEIVELQSKIRELKMKCELAC